MYTLFKAEIRSWRNRILQAEIQLSGPFPETSPHWWEGVALTVPPPPDLTCAVSAKGPMLDNYFTGNRFNLYSERLVALFRDVGVHFETFPATIVARKTKEPLAVHYKVFHLLELHPALAVHRATGDRRGIKSIPEKWQSHQRPLFRAQESAELVLIREALKQQLEAAGITGCQYTPIEEFTAVW